METEEILRRAAEAADRAAQQQAQVPVQPSPVPTAISVGQGHMPDGSIAVILVAYTPTGQSVFFLDPDFAKSIAAGMEKAAQASGSGLVLPK